MVSCVINLLSNLAKLYFKAKQYPVEWVQPAIRCVFLKMKGERAVCFIQPIFYIERRAITSKIICLLYGNYFIVPEEINQSVYFSCHTLLTLQ